jgi:hypothetical protein
MQDQPGVRLWLDETPGEAPKLQGALYQPPLEPAQAAGRVLASAVAGMVKLPPPPQQQQQ